MLQICIYWLKLASHRLNISLAEPSQRVLQAETACVGIQCIFQMFLKSVKFMLPVNNFLGQMLDLVLSLASELFELWFGL